MWEFIKLFLLNFLLFGTALAVICFIVFISFTYPLVGIILLISVAALVFTLIQIV